MFDTEEGAEYISLSAYTADCGKDACRVARDTPRREDDSDVFGQMCDWWQHKHQTRSSRERHDEDDVGFEALRFSQLEEAEAVKRAFARRSWPINAATVERGLVMPKHRFHTTQPLFNKFPDLTVNPFWEKSKKGKKGKTKGKAKGNAKRSTGTGAAAGKTRSTSRGKSRSPSPPAKP